MYDDFEESLDNDYPCLFELLDEDVFDYPRAKKNINFKTIIDNYPMTTEELKKLKIVVLRKGKKLKKAIRSKSQNGTFSIENKWNIKNGDATPLDLSYPKFCFLVAVNQLKEPDSAVIPSLSASLIVTEPLASDHEFTLIQKLMGPGFQFAPKLINDHPKILLGDHKPTNELQIKVLFAIFVLDWISMCQKNMYRGCFKDFMHSKKCYEGEFLDAAQKNWPQYSDILACIKSKKSNDWTSKMKTAVDLPQKLKEPLPVAIIQNLKTQLEKKVLAREKKRLKAP